MSLWLSFFVCSVSPSWSCSIPIGCPSVEAAWCWWCNNAEWTLWNFGTVIIVSCEWYICWVSSIFVWLIVVNFGRLQLDNFFCRYLIFSLWCSFLSSSNYICLVCWLVCAYSRVLVFVSHNFDIRIFFFCQQEQKYLLSCSVIETSQFWSHMIWISKNTFLYF